MGSHKQPNFVKGEGLVAVLLGVPQNASFYESVSTTFLPILLFGFDLIHCSVLPSISGRPGGILTVIFNSVCMKPE